MVKRMITSVNAFITLLGLGNGTGRIIRHAAIIIAEIIKRKEFVRKLIERRNMVAADAGRPRNTFLSFNG